MPGTSDEAKVWLGGIDPAVPDWSAARILAALPPQIPTELLSAAGGPASLIVTRKGYRDASRSIDLALPALTVTTVSPETVPEREGEKIHIVGSGFGPATQAPPTVTLGALTLNVEPGHSDTLLVAKLPAAATAEGAALSDAGKSETLIVRREGWQQALQSLKLTKPQ